jgi:hypothetical protein
LRRYHLQKVLCNDFEVYRADDEMSDVRFPVFLRNENDHRGNLTPLIQTRAELDEAIESHPEALIVEFIDTSDKNGIYRKYSYYRIGDRLFPGHLDFSTSWLVKGGPHEPADPRLLSEHRAFVFESPHEKQVAEAFHRARIDYGRIDYAVSEGRLQVFEINTNPTLSGAVLPEWGELPEVTRTIVAAVLELDRPVQHIEEVRMTRLPPYCWPWKPRFVR